MPGILPMKVIKVGTSAQTRIAQACDRCRSKKIRCDGIRPSCSQCVNVGFECKTSDKLSRRAFPRGYTESLEERVRGLEAEVRELKELLDEKDEKIDMLSRLHSHSPQPFPGRRSSLQSDTPGDCKQDGEQSRDDVFKVVQSPFLLDVENSDSYFVGTSNPRTLIDAFKHKVQETGRSCPELTPDAFFPTEPRASMSPLTSNERLASPKAPPRLVSDQLINIFFQEWAPLFPVLHRPTFLSLYGEYVASPESIDDQKSIAQLNLVFGIAAQSSENIDVHQIESFEAQWQAAIETFLMDNSLATLQCFVLAQIYLLQKGDHDRLLKYKGLAISLSQRLGLHQSQKRFALGALTSETRKKVFWSLYTVDCFSAAQLGLPKLMKEEDIYCEYPVDADDEYVTERGFLPSLPGEFTRLSSALALFRACRILANVLAENYPASASHEISFRKLNALSDELHDWSSALPAHLRLQFVQDKPSTNVTGSRAPILSLTYHYIRSLIFRPAVCASSSLGDRASSSIMALAGSSKHMIQIIQLLEERKLSFSICLNKNEILTLAGFGLLFQGIESDRDGKLIRSNQSLVCAVIDMLERGSAPGAAEFCRLGCSMLSMAPAENRRPALSRHNSDGAMAAPHDFLKATQKHLKAVIASRFASTTGKHIHHDPKDSRRATAPSIPNASVAIHPNPSISSIHSEPSTAHLDPSITALPELTLTRSEPALSPISHRASIPLPTPKHQKKTRLTAQPLSATNLDFLSFEPEPVPATYLPPQHKPEVVSPTDWERLLSTLDNGQTNIYDNIYGGLPVDALGDVLPPLTLAAGHVLALSPDAPQIVWGQEIWGGSGRGQPVPQSVLSFSDESLTSGGEEFAGVGEVGSVGSGSQEPYRGILIPELGTSPAAMGELAGLDGNFGL